MNNKSVNSYINSYAVALVLSLLGIKTVWALEVHESAVGGLCNSPYRCGIETRDPDNRSRPAIIQPMGHNNIQGHCSSIPAHLGYMISKAPLKCSGSDVIRLRERTAYPQEILDKNSEFIQSGNREEAQKILLKPLVYKENLKFKVQENWFYKKKVGDFVDCRGQFGYEGGEIENYTTRCHRNERMEKVFRYRIEMSRDCAQYTPAPPPPESSPGGYNSGSGSSDSSPAPSIYNSAPQSPSGSGEDADSHQRRGDSGWDSSIEIKNLIPRLPLTDSLNLREPARRNGGRFGLREVESITEESSGSSGTYGCDRWSSYKEVNRTIEEIEVPAESLSYTCVRQRNQWCTWYIDQAASQLCPEQKTAQVTVEYKTPNDWNPRNRNYDDQLPNKFDLLMGEGEFVKIAANTGLSPKMQPSIVIKNAIKDKYGKYRALPWNEYEATIRPATISCAYQNQQIKIDIETLRRHVQSAPNPLQIPRDQNGNILAFEGTDSKGRPAILNLLNPARGLVLDRSNLSRIFGQEPDQNLKISKGLISQVEKGGVPKKFWENTKFWMRLYWKDKRGQEVKVTQAKQFDINKANPIGDYLAVPLDGTMGMEKFYTIAVPFEKIFGFLGGDAGLDPNSEYYIEIKVAQPGFNGIYSSGYSPSDTTPENEREIKDKKAFSESLVIPLKALSSKPTLWQKMLNFRSKMYYRPKIKTTE